MPRSSPRAPGANVPEHGERRGPLPWRARKQACSRPRGTAGRRAACKSFRKAIERRLMYDEYCAQRSQAV
eukprot:6553179-Alexandrium_andersonii.AAC.1